MAQRPSTTGDVEDVAALPGEPRNVSAAGVTRSGERLVTIENGSPFQADSRRRMVLVADDERAARAVLEAIRWFKTASPRNLRERWALSAVLIAYRNDATPAQRLEFPPAKGFFDDAAQPESRYVWRWTVYQAPDLIVQVRGGDVMSRGTPPPASLAAAMMGGTELGTTGAIFITARESDGPALLQHVLADARQQESEVHATLRARVSRRPLEIARVLAEKYPQTASVSYIPSVAWANTLRLAEITKDATLRRKVMEQTQPWLSRERPLFGDRVALTAVAGTLIYADLALRGEEPARGLARQGADEALQLASNGYARYGQGWTDDMFMTSAILSRTGTTPGREQDLAHLSALLVSYAKRLQRDDGIFVHFTDGRIAWGRGNGFAALGVTEALNALPAKHPERPLLLDIYRRHMRAMSLMQAPDGMWRQVVDEPGAYRELSVTAMTVVAMARGVRLGWLDGRAFRATIDRAWRALAAHITSDAAVVDVCTSTGSQATLRHYLDRPAISGFDDRGGAMSLYAAIEMALLR